MERAKNNISKAFRISADTILVYLCRDWQENRFPPIFIMPERRRMKRLQRASFWRFGEISGYFVKDGWISFMVLSDDYPEIIREGVSIYLVGEFNNWERAEGKTAWRLEPVHVDKKKYLLINIRLGDGFAWGSKPFKFITSEGQWLEPSSEAPNIVLSPIGVRNYQISLEVTGQHVFLAKLPQKIESTGVERLYWGETGNEKEVSVLPESSLLEMQTSLQLGARIERETTSFRLFAPRAEKVTVSFFKDLDNPKPKSLELEDKKGRGCWEVNFSCNLHKWYYYFQIKGPDQDKHSNFDSSFKILDPYAVATVGPKGPGIIWDQELLPKRNRKSQFSPPLPSDLVIVEAHLRDLLHSAPSLTPDEKKGFAGLTKWLQVRGNCLKGLGANAVELQPVQEIGDSYPKEEYHWGYMTTNFFSPESSYAKSPEKGSQIKEFQELVKAFHQEGLAVILDVVYNHVGIPNHLLHIDKYYYFDLDVEGNLINWSGCGNTFRADTPMGKRLIIDSLRHLVETYDIDGFRFDLADLLGLQVLKEIEIALKKIKPSVILIAEPWSFRGNISGALKHTGFSFWNEGYRDFIKDYLLGNGDQQGIFYYITGSPFYLTARPAQTVNYVESHDDHCWLDRITENPGRNGFSPTFNDRRRTHLMIAVLMASLGIPMISAGQDLLRSKQGHFNTYRDGETNAINYRRGSKFATTPEYFRSWIKFRLSDRGKLFRLKKHPPKSYFRFYKSHDSTAVAILFNADLSEATHQLLFAINPHLESVVIPLESLGMNGWKQLADNERLNEEGVGVKLFRMKKGILELPTLSCGLWGRG